MTKYVVILASGERMTVEADCFELWPGNVGQPHVLFYAGGSRVALFLLDSLIGFTAAERSEFADGALVSRPDGEDY